MLRDATIEECACDNRVGLRLGQFESGVLELRQRSAKGLAFFAVIDCQLNAAFHGANRAATDDQALLRELLHHLIEALALFGAQQVFRRDFDVVEE